ncbi:MAG TPA: nucleotide exchange factor GrpE [Vicinamibacteria bacterium]|nr:nucleotide exchange factor GrpE [Vicinamibacteria bacterium]
MTAGGDGEDDRAGGGDSEPRGLTGVDVDPLPPPDRAQVEGLRRECEELRDQLLRKRAEFENYRKRVDRERQQAGVEAAANLLSAIIPTIDNLERALVSTGGDETLRMGVELTLREMFSHLERQGVSVEDPAGRRFDPARHQALSHEVVPGKAEGTVVETFQKGYSLGERLVRPAMVKVAKAEDDATGEPGPEAVH